jgi:hypothetical protein
VLGDDSSEPRYIRNATGQGYCFIAPVAGPAAHPQPTATRISAPELGKLPTQLARVVGRKQAMQDIIVLLGEWRFVTVVGRPKHTSEISSQSSALAIVPTP